MNQVFYVVGATLCYVGGYGIMIFLLGVLTELCIEIWDGKFIQICNRVKINPSDVFYLAQNRKEIEMTIERRHVRYPNIDDAPSGAWYCPECGEPNQYVKHNSAVAYCRFCGQAVDMDYYRRYANDKSMDT